MTAHRQPHPSGLDAREVRRLCAAFARRRGPKLTAAQFGQPPGSVADWVGHWSVQRGDPRPERPNNRQEFERHLRGCQVCQQIEAARTAAPDTLTT